MTDTAIATPDPDDDGSRLETRWFQDPEGRIVQTLATADTPLDLPDEWTLLPDELGARLFAEQQQHAEDQMAEAAASAADEAAQAEAERIELLVSFAGKMGLTVEQAAKLLSVPLPNERPSSDPVLTMLHPSAGPGSPSAAPADNLGL